jgi:hypothetical protein
MAILAICLAAAVGILLIPETSPEKTTNSSTPIPELLEKLRTSRTKETIPGRPSLESIEEAMQAGWASENDANTAKQYYSRALDLLLLRSVGPNPGDGALINGERGTATAKSKSFSSNSEELCPYCFETDLEVQIYNSLQALLGASAP